MSTASTFLRGFLLQQSQPTLLRPLSRPAMLAGTLFGAVAASALASSVVLARTGMQLAWNDLLPITALAFLLLGLAAFCHMRYEDKRLAHAAAVLGIATLALMTCGVLSNGGLRLRMPLSDPLLATIDASIGIHVGSIVRWSAEVPILIDGLAIVYNASHILLTLLICWLIVRKHFAKVWELLATVTLSMQFVALVSILMPAWGAMHHFSLLDLQGNGLPLGAGVYHGEAFRHFYEGSDPYLRLTDTSGVVTFPSFHTVLALLIAQALFRTPLQWASFVVCGVTIFSTIPIGGHYAVDLAGGAVIWLICATWARKLTVTSDPFQ